MSTDGRSTNDNKQVGESIEKWRARQRGAERTPEAWFDMDDDGTPIETKSTVKREKQYWAEERKPRRGRYQIEESNHENLVDHNGEYDFNLRDREKDDVIETVTMSAEEVDDLIREKDLKWPDTGKLKLPWSYVHDPADIPGESA